MKKLLALILAFCLLATPLTACGNTQASEPSESSETQASTTEPTETESPTTEPTETVPVETLPELTTEASEEPSTAVVYTADDLADFTKTTLDGLDTGKLIYSVENTATSVTLNFSMQGIDSTVSAIVLDYDTYADDWQTIIVGALSHEMYESLRLVADAWGLSDVAIVQNLVSEDGSITYASAVNGEITTDIVTELASSLDPSDRG